jgi:LDH2 family malate/lactate/ureidoglycolate dehydrogenase
MMAPEEFGDRMQTLIGEVKAVETAPGVEGIFFPGELEDRNGARNRGRGITLADNTWNSLTGLAADTHTDVPTLIESGQEARP